MKHSREELLIVGSVAFASFMCTLDGSIVNITLPSIAHYFNVGTSAVSWVVLSYLLAIVALLLPAGKIGDRIGLRRTFLAGYAFFTTGSLLCGLSPSLEALIASRSFQGLGAALLISSAYAIIPSFLPKNVTGWAFGLLATAGALGVTCGAPMGGFLTDYASWHWIFLINVPVGGIALCVAMRSLPKGTLRFQMESLARYDFPGTLLGASGLISVMLALNFGQEWGWVSHRILLIFSTGLLLIFFFFWWERCHPDPLVDVNLLKNRNFCTGLLASGLGYMALSGSGFMMPFFLELGKHLTPAHVGSVIMLMSVTMMMVGPVAGRLSDRIPARRLIGLGMFMASAVFLLFSEGFRLPGLWSVLVYMVCLGGSYGLFMAPMSGLVMSAPPPEQGGMASGLFATSNNLSQAIGICLMETVFSLTLPAKSSVKELALAADTHLAGPLSQGFQNALLCGAFLCGLSCLVVWRIHVVARPQDSSPPHVG